MRKHHDVFFYSGFRVQGSTGAVRRIQTGKRRECLWGDAQRFLDSRFPSYRSLPQWGRLRYEDAAIPDTLPSPRGEGAPKGRIGHWRYERERERESQADDLR